MEMMSHIIGSVHQYMIDRRNLSTSDLSFRKGIYIGLFSISSSSIIRGE